MKIQKQRELQDPGVVFKVRRRTGIPRSSRCL